jgi:hypothetical protein
MVSLSKCGCIAETVLTNGSYHEQAPEIVSLYALNASPAQIRKAIRDKFEKNRYDLDRCGIAVVEEPTGIPGDDGLLETEGCGCSRKKEKF